MRKSVAAVALSLLLIGCRTGKTAVVRNTDSVSVAKTERSERVALSALGNLEAEVREVTFYKPDSLGVSHVKSVRKSRIKGTQKAKKEIVAVADTRDSVSVKASQKVEKKGRSVRSWKWLVAAISILLIGLFIGINKFKK